ncbi:transposase [Streptomyces sp. NPDC101151]|uniref:transposase n=1 Tax=Streptomyces sp. NPDC101151 TaxID=3366115 RepID=UPI0038133DB8
MLRAEFAHLKSQMPTLWSSSFFVASVGAVSADTVEKYINAQWERPWTRKRKEDAERAPRIQVPPAPHCPSGTGAVRDAA